MKLNLSFLLIFSFLIICIAPQTTHAEELVNEVFLLERDDKVMAFSGLRNRWFEKKLHSGETVIKSTYNGNVAVAYTTERALAFSAIKNRWAEERFRIRESVTSISAEGNVATVITTSRALGFSAKTGRWVESQFNLKQ